jgi:hypothetical protein
MKRSIIDAAIVCASACGSSAPPTPQPTPPAPSTFTLSGTVTEAAPTANVRLAVARVEVIDTAQAGTFAITDGSGTFSIPNLSGQLNVRVTAPGYVETTVGRNMTQNQTLTAGLMPVYKPLNEEYNGPLSGGDSTCSDGIFTKPCKIIQIPIHNSGILDAAIGWAGSADLDLTLFRGGTVIVAARGVGSIEKISTNVQSNTLHELRITYYSGASIATYNLKVAHPN